MRNLYPISGPEEQAFYGESLILLEGAAAEFLSCLEMICRYRVSRGRHDPVCSYTARIKSAASMRAKLERLGLPVTLDHALHQVFDAAGVRVICPFIDDIYTTVALIRTIPGITIDRERDYVRHAKPNGYRSYHLTVSLPPRYVCGEPAEQVWLEVQLRTIAMDCWASIEHELKYKHALPHQQLIAGELKRCADEITATDLSLQTIREFVAELPKKEE